MADRSPCSCPTTVLAQQHFNTFRERMADYPVRIELLSRFRTPRASVSSVIADLAAGAVDIVIGTHRLLQTDIAFKDLGLVVIDEEQRFGVMHKEKFKQLRTLGGCAHAHRHADSAHALSRARRRARHEHHRNAAAGPAARRNHRRPIRRAPHPRRHPARTAIAAARFFSCTTACWHHRGRRATTARRSCRRRASSSATARWTSDELEEVMTAFVNGETDVLLSTTIIESGLDIPNANTIIIDRADRFGLSDLYQLRGRVGRYKHQAYAYLLLPRHAGLLADARKRISAIKQYSTLGSGFKIAMRDLEIRGAGNLLGAEQSGHITAVGFELYCQLLKQSVAALKGEKVKPRVEVQVRFDFLALNPGEEASPVQSPRSKVQNKMANLDINIPREVASYVIETNDSGSDDSALRTPHSAFAAAQRRSSRFPTFPRRASALRFTANSRRPRRSPRSTVCKRSCATALGRCRPPSSCSCSSANSRSSPANAPSPSSKSRTTASCSPAIMTSSCSAANSRASRKSSLSRA